MKRVGILIAGTLVALAFPIPAAFAACHFIEFSPAAYTVGEAAGKVTLTVTNNGGAQARDQMVDYKTVAGTAKSPMDFTSKSGTITFTVGAPDEVTIDIPIRNDTVDEPAERFQVKLSNVRPPSSCAPPPEITGDTATVTIGDNDRPKPKPPPAQAPVSSPSPTPKKTTPSPSPTQSRTPSPSPSPSVSVSPTPTTTAFAAPGTDSDGGVSGGAVAGIVAGVIVLGGGAAFFVRRRFLT
jgi:outer membrane biosynthesis protein TonB